MTDEKISLELLRQKLKEKIGPRGIRETAAEIGVSPATLSRLLRGHVPDIETFTRLCRWLRVEPSQVLRVQNEETAPSQPIMSMHFRRKKTVDKKTAAALTDLILAAHRAIVHTQKDMDD